MGAAERLHAALEHAHDDGQHPELPLLGQEKRKHRDARVGRDAHRDELCRGVLVRQPPKDEGRRERHDLGHKKRQQKAGGVQTQRRAVGRRHVDNGVHAVDVAEERQQKTTTTSMVSHIILEGDCDPTISVGGILPAIHGNIRVGNSETFVTEACEYTNSFLSFFPKISVILNMDADHLDFFKDIDDIRHSFRKFAELLPSDGTLIINADTPEYETITRGLPCHVLTYGLEHEADYTSADITWDKYGHPSFSVLFQGKKIGSYYLRVPGIHNVSNALAAIAVGRLLELPDDVIVKGLGSFTGTDRRFQYKGEIGGVNIIDDYAHHPTEIEATLHAAKNYPHQKLWCVFQPHTYTRTKALLPEFAKALTLADHVVLADIYAARETDDLGISSQDLQKQIQELGTPCEYFPTFDEIESFLLKSCAHGDLLITMGAGDVVNIGEHLLGK